MKRAAKDPTAWRKTPEFDRKYEAAKRQAQFLANGGGFDYGLEIEDSFRSVRFFMLPRRENRTGHELRCEVVSCESLDRTQEGHGAR